MHYDFYAKQRELRPTYEPVGGKKYLQSRGLHCRLSQNRDKLCKFSIPQAIDRKFKWSTGRWCEKIKINFNFLQNFTNCYQQCENQTELLADVNSVYGPPDASFHLYCRDSKRLVIEVVPENSDDGHDENEKFIYLLVIQETTMPFVDRYIYIVSFHHSCSFFLSPGASNWT